jgi:CSLREA domain-containing protein
MKPPTKRLAVPLLGAVLLAALSACAGISTLTVNTTDDVDDGTCNTTHCSLREAINKVNSLTGTITITFDIGGGGVQTIKPLTALPVITGVVVIDGSTQPGFTTVPLIELDGNVAVDPTGGGGDVDGLVLSGGGSTVKYLVINQFSGNGIRIEAPGGNRIENNYIGTNVSGTLAMGNQANGVLIDGDGNHIGEILGVNGNLISGNAENGVFFRSGGKDYVQGNLIGTDVTGSAKLGNGMAGVLGTTDMIQIGGTTANYRNVISGNGSDGVRLEGWTCQVQGNYIGVDIGGFHPLGNYENGVNLVGADTIIVGGSDPQAGNVIADHGLLGVYIDDNSKNIQVLGNKIGTDAAGTAALPNVKAGIRVGGTNQQIGVPGPGGRNLISGNMGPGIAVVSGATNITIQNNYIGTDATGTAAIGNSNGIEASPSTTNVIIGGSPYGEGNLISGNDNAGVVLADNIKVRGNYIGTDNSGLNPLGNREDGVLIKGFGNEISGSPSFYNTIAFNGGHGVAVISGSGSASNNLILRNSIHDNGGLGIAIDQNVVIPNDNQDPDSGDNLRQNYPVLTEAISDPVAMQSTISGELNSTPGTVFTIEIYTNAMCDPSGHGEGHRWIRTLTATTDASGNATFTTLFPSTYIDLANFITATATDPAGNTSGFSKCIQPVEPSTITPTPTPTPAPAAMSFKPFFDPAEILYGPRCSPDTVRLSVEIGNPPEPIAYVLLFVRLMNKENGEKTAWGGGMTMIAAGKNTYYYDLMSYDVPEYSAFESAWLQYQFVVYNKAEEKIGYSDVYGDISFLRCGADRPKTTG